MNFVLHPWHIVLLALSAMMDEERDKAIAYLLMENQVLREKLGKGRILLNDDQRRRSLLSTRVESTLDPDGRSPARTSHFGRYSFANS